MRGRDCLRVTGGAEGEGGGGYLPSGEEDAETDPYLSSFPTNPMVINQNQVFHTRLCQGRGSNDIVGERAGRTLPGWQGGRRLSRTEERVGRFRQHIRAWGT